MDELKPCPFCGDPMQERGGQIMHVEQTLGCPMRDLSLPIERAGDWNTRTPDAEALIAIARAMQERCAEITKRPLSYTTSRYTAPIVLHDSHAAAILSLDTEALVREYMEKK